MNEPNPPSSDSKPQGSSPYSRPRPRPEEPAKNPEHPGGSRKTDPPTAVRPDPIVPVEEPDEDAPTELRPGLAAELPPPPRPPSPAGQLPPLRPPPPVTRRFESVAPTALPARPEPRRSALRALVATVGLMAGVGVGGAAGIIALWHRAKQPTPPPDVATAAPAPPPSAPAPAPVACRVLHRAVELRPTVRAHVPLYAAAVPGSSHVALGYADSLYDATGLDVDPHTLHARVALSRMGVAPVDGVVPLAKKDTSRFAIDRNDAGLESAHTIAATVPFRIGYANGSLSRLAPGGAPRPVWTGLARGKKPTGLRAASVPGLGHAITFRLGGGNGRVMVGWLAPDGSRKSALSAIDISAAALGTPSIAAGAGKITVAVAARTDELSPWGIRIATAPVGKLPVAAHYFALPKGGPGHDAFAPTLTGLPGGRWLLSWTEGTRSNHVVRAQTLDAGLSRVGAAITLSPSNANAGQSVVQASGGQAVGFYLVKGRHGYQLWATSLDCT